MNCCMSEFVLEEDSSSIFPPSVSRIPDATGEDFVELIWQKGPVFRRLSPQAQGQVFRRISPEAPHSESAFSGCTAPFASASAVTSYTAATTAAVAELFMEEDEMASWLANSLGDDDKGAGVGGDYLPEKTQAATTVERPPLPPETQGKLSLFSGTRESTAAVASLPLVAPNESTVAESSVTSELARSRAPESRVSSFGGRGETGMWEHGVTSSSGVICEGEAAAKTAARTNDRKRKAPEGDDTDYHSEDAEFESSDKKEDTRRSTTQRRSRAAEVHNLSERRRTDRINEKLKTLQQLIPRCNKSDKASMLDDAIEYLKSLQMQVQMMSMGCNMVPMMFPGIQQYKPPVGMAIPMGMNMGMGLGMGMEMSAGTLNHHPMTPFLPVMSSRHIVPTGAAPLSQRLPMQPFHAPAVVFSDQMNLQGSSQTVPASNLACVGSSNARQTPNPAQQHGGFHHQPVHTQIRAP